VLDLAGNCTLTIEADCAAPSVWLAGQDCDPNPCEQPPATGACCYTDGTCQVLTEAECVQAGGEYQGDGVACTDDLCEPVIPTEETSWGQIKSLYR